MKKTSPASIDFVPEGSAIDTLVLDRAAADRALDFYLPDTSLLDVSPSAITTLKDSANLQAALSCASDLLRCAARSANEVSNALKGVQRDLALQIINRVEKARQHIENSLAGLKASWEMIPGQTDWQATE